MNFYHLVRKCLWLVIACTSVAIGLKLVGVDLESMLHLQSFDRELRYFVGFAGFGSLVDLFVIHPMVDVSNCNCK